MQNILQWALGTSNMWARKENRFKKSSRTKLTIFQAFGRNIENSDWNVSPGIREFTVLFYSIFIYFQHLRLLLANGKIS